MGSSVNLGTKEVPVLYRPKKLAIPTKGATITAGDAGRWNPRGMWEGSVIHGCSTVYGGSGASARCFRCNIMHWVTEYMMRKKTSWCMGASSWQVSAHLMHRVVAAVAEKETEAGTSNAERE